MRHGDRIKERSVEHKLGAKAAVNVTGGLTDSQVASHVVSRGLTTAYPLCCVCMELAAQLESRNSLLELEWVPRDQNAEADALADGDVRGFNPSLRADAKAALQEWLVLDRLLDQGQEFYEEIRAVKDSAFSHVASNRTGGQRPAKKLRERDPW